MTEILIIFHVLVSVMLVMIVLLQTGKGADIGAVFGGGTSQTLFGSAGPGGFLAKLTTAIAIIFMVTSLMLAYFFSKTTSSSTVMNETVPEARQTLPADRPQKQGEAGPPISEKTAVPGGETQETRGSEGPE